MLMAGISGLLVYICGRVFLHAVPTGWRYIRQGWSWISGVRGVEDPRKDAEARRQLTMGGYYMISGGLWLLGALISGLLVLLFAYWTLFYLGLWPASLPL